MRRRPRQTNLPLHGSTLLVVAFFLALGLAPAAAAQTRAQRKGAAHTQHEKADKLRTALNGKAQKERTLEEYKAVVNAFRRVYLITPHAQEVSASLLAVAETYQEMGRQFDPKYYQSAIDTYQFLLHEYPASRYRDDALFTIAQIQQVDLNQLDVAQLSFEEFLKRYPRSSKAEQARQALAEIAAARERESKTPARELSEQREKQQRIPQVTSIRHWNAEHYTRIVVAVEDEVKFDSARIANPDRIYFDLTRAKLSSTLAGKTLEVQNGFLKTIRVAQNQTGVVRVVLEVDKVQDYSVFLLPNPYRLVVDIHGEAPSSAAKAAEKKEPPKTAEEKPAGPPEKAERPAKTEAAKTEPAKPASAPPEPPPKTRKEAKVERAEASRPPEPAKPTRDGGHSLTRALGLKIGRIVIDAGHGGHDTGTVGPSGLMEKDLCLDLALRLGKMIEERLPGTEVHFTREDDTFVPLEIRTALANQARADLFLSIHANSSRDRDARGVETYYLNLAASEDALEVAARENALSQSSIHELQDLIKKIANNEKVEESRELAADIQQALSTRLKRYSRQIKNRGVKRAPFVVLIGANMPSALAEVSFLSNPSDEQALKKGDHRQRVVEGLYRGVESYLQSLNSLSYNPPRSSEANRE